MKSHVIYIGVVDNNNNIHHVEFTTGVNVITGRSSTGKSAMIEIFDYCFGSNEFTIPSGVITNNADLYFVVMSVKDSYIVLGRTKERKGKIFLKDESRLPNIKSLTDEYFDTGYFITIPDFKKSLGHRFGLNISDIDTDLKDKEYRGRKKGRPSVRNMTSFLLQHQNLIANKHSIFFRFDEKEKREQVIEQFRIFAGMVDAEYFSKRQRLADKERELKKLEKQQRVNAEKNDANRETIDRLMNEYCSITGKQLLEDRGEYILAEPQSCLDKMKEVKISIDYESSASLDPLKDLSKELNGYHAKYRDLKYKLSGIDASIKYADDYKNIPLFSSEVELGKHLTECPICHIENSKIPDEAQQLNKALLWLNDELSKTESLIDSFVSDKNEIKRNMALIAKKIIKVKYQIARIEEITDKLEQNKSFEEQALKVRLKIENFLEILINENYNICDLEQTKSEVRKLRAKIREEYNLIEKIKVAEDIINDKMKDIGGEFDFEKSYQPINLKFSLETFELCHEKESERIYLRSMGSGANWLYSHLALFMSIQYYFCSLQEKSLLPPILFLDQPSQVYFPTSIKDDKTEFNANEINKHKAGNSELNEDINAVTNLFDKLIKFCSDTFKSTGITPQIIVTDHADHLELRNGDFEKLVNGRRWRKRDSGFINQKQE
ncbi:DUF3732 domain-containing protein [Bathymodiolus thermophilus thioautotrophic gill symbiont]|uniref:Plasmid related protein n=1 Tax=Bathymodiolus thermophilus thioautotrophic gill symbiont TaxID=2360 RepID=A0A8H8XB18_9GAMM|nr:DUF3732 domain-containing protein [Bathymodiolus thermophilus thioautotrophic gill symbiont]CAB5494953.1 Plasmid related protein [Bathymodiolus thermophilus thioautotrophic gill symbiont]